MKKIVLVIAGIVLAAGRFSAQNVLYSHNFDGISINSWVMNENQNGINYWVQNATYTGNAGASIPDTPAQPMSFDSAPNSMYMHITSIANCNGFVPVSCNANYTPGDLSSNYAAMLNGISTIGESNVTFSFWYLCVGDNHEAYGQLEYSIDGGTSWFEVGPALNNTPDWTQLDVADVVFDNQSDLRFRFHWYNTTVSVGGDPSLAVDEITITSDGLGGNPISVTEPTHGQYCAGESLLVQFDAPGPFNAGNVFTAELSGPTGSFASPTAIGTLTSTGGAPLTISATLPTSANGSAYRIRVIASDPATIGSNNGGDLIINPLPNVSVTSVPADGVICEGETIAMSASGAATYSWTPTVSNPSSSDVTATPLVSTTYTVTGTSQDGCSADANLSVTVEDCASLTEVSNAAFTLFPNPASELMQVHYTQEAAVKAVEVRDVNGRVVFSATEPVHTIDVQTLTKGVYTLRVLTSESVFVQQFVRL